MSLQPSGSSQTNPSSSDLQGCNNTKVDNEDLMSRLSSDILRNIVSKISIGDAARTSLSLCQWKHIWPSRSWPDLSISWLEMFRHRELWESCENPCPVFRKKFVDAVDWFMGSYQGGKVDSFKVTFCLRSDSATSLDRWIRLALKMGAEKLVLDFCCPKSCELVNDGDRYVLRDELFEGTEPNVKEMSLLSCSLAPTPISRLSGLKVLNLWYMCFSLGDLHSMLPYLVNLEKLCLVDCIISTNLTKRLRLGALVRLKSFVLRSCQGIEGIELSNPNMTLLSCVPMAPIWVNLNGAPGLLELCLYVDSAWLKLLFSQLHRALPLLKTLHLFTNKGWDNYIHGPIRASSSVTYLNLVCNFCLHFDVSTMILTLQSLPCLKKLVLQTDHFADSIYQPSRELGDFVHECLLHVEIHGFIGTGGQMRFATYLVTHAPSLQRLRLFGSLRNYSKYGWLDVSRLMLERCSWSESEIGRIHDELRQHMNRKGLRSGLKLEIRQ